MARGNAGNTRPAHEGEPCGPIRWGNFNPTISGWKRHIDHQPESKLSHKELLAALLIAAINADEVHAKEATFSIGLKSPPSC